MLLTLTSLPCVSSAWKPLRPSRSLPFLSRGKPRHGQRHGQRQLAARPGKSGSADDDHITSYDCRRCGHGYCWAGWLEALNKSSTSHSAVASCRTALARHSSCPRAPTLSGRQVCSACNPMIPTKYLPKGIALPLSPRSSVMRRFFRGGKFRLRTDLTR